MSKVSNYYAQQRPSFVEYSEFIFSFCRLLYYRLRSSEAERGRNRVRMQALKEKVGELEAELSRVAEENSKLKIMGERIEGLRATITRKDTMIQSLKTQVEKLQAQIDSLKTTEVQLQMEADKRAK